MNTCREEQFPLRVSQIDGIIALMIFPIALGVLLIGGFLWALFETYRQGRRSEFLSDAPSAHYFTLIFGILAISRGIDWLSGEDPFNGLLAGIAIGMIVWAVVLAFWFMGFARRLSKSPGTLDRT